MIAGLCILGLGLGAGGLWAHHRAEQGAGTAPAGRTQLALEPFRSVELSVLSGDIRVAEGADYALSYRLHGKEEVRELEVRDDTLYFSTGLDRMAPPRGGEWEVVLTIPAGAELDRLSLSTAAGDVELSHRTFGWGELISTSGDVRADGLACEELSARSVSGQVRVRESRVDRLRAESTSGAVEAGGRFGTVWMKSVAGACRMSGEASDRVEAETVSGPVEVTGPVGVLRAESIGGVRLDGKDRGRSLSTGEGLPEVKLKSVSGFINVNA